jgi:xanthine dehydrogenase accessory factor
MMKRPFAYAAMVGSLRKAKMMKKRLLAKGFSLSQINRIFCPAGLNINAITPEEIAISIAAQIIMVKNETLKDRLPDRRSWPKQTHGVS